MISERIWNTEFIARLYNQRQPMAADSVLLLLLARGSKPQSCKVDEILALLHSILCEQNYSVAAFYMRNTNGDIFSHGEVYSAFHLKKKSCMSPKA